MCSGIGRVNWKGFQDDLAGRPTVIYNSICCLCCVIRPVINCGIDSADNRDYYFYWKKYNLYYFLVG